MREVGSLYLGNGLCHFTVWAPLKKSMLLHFVQPVSRIIEMQQDEEGYFVCEEKDVLPGTRYFFRPEGGKDLPDPASHYQPQGVHGPSEVIDHNAYSWKDKGWQPAPFSSLVFYEIHIGTFTEEGTFEAAIRRLDDLVSAGINAIEIMPVSQFPGNRNWGYDGVFPYAVQNSYGGPDGLKQLVDACHEKGIAVFLDVVYNHLGPEGNYLSLYGPYFTNKYCTPWGDAINYDNEWCDGVRDFFSGNALYWFEHYHIDGLRCDAIHMVLDTSAIHFWEYLGQKVKELEQKLQRSFYLVAESDLNSPKVIRHPNDGGYGFDAQWLDDFHHALYTILDKKGKERYEDFGALEQLAKGYREGFVHSGEWVNFRKRKFGRSSAGIRGDRFVVFNQNHDQVGNRVKGERFSVLVDFERLKLAAAGLLLSPYVPLLFMGEEYGEEAPFLYFVSHSDKELIHAVQEGRKKEFAAFGFGQETADPQDEKTFLASKLKWSKRSQGKHAILLRWHRELIAMRRSHPALLNLDKSGVTVYIKGQNLLALHRKSASGDQHLACLFNFSEDDTTYQLPGSGGRWRVLLHSKDSQWMEPGGKEDPRHLADAMSKQDIVLAPLSISVYEMV